MDNSQKLSKPVVSSSNLKEKSISKVWLALIFIFLTLIVVLIVTTISLFFYQKITWHSSPENIWNPEKDLNEFITSNFSDYYKPAIIQPTQLEGFSVWEYSWGVIDEDINAFVEYNEDNKDIRRIAGSASLDEDISLDEDSAIRLVADVFDGVILGGEWDCDSLVVELSANPSSGEAPLLGVDLIAAVSGTVKGEIGYKFDCTSDSIWEKEIITDENPYVAVGLCDYMEDKNYSARVKVERGGMSVMDDTDSSFKSNVQCRNQWVFNKDKYEIVVSKLKNLQFINIGFCIIPNNSNYYENENCF
jgi:hypothetical protein